jgi:integrase
MAARITEDAVKSAAIPASGSTTLWDADITGFGVRVHSTGARSFFLNYRVNGREKRVTIGQYPTWSAARARVRAKELRQAIDKEGRDPAGERRERREAPTVQDLINRYVRDHLSTSKRVREKEEKRMLAEIGDILGRDTKVASVHYGDMEDLHKKITNGYDGRKPRPVRANRVLACASTMFSLSLRPLAGEDKPWRNAVDGNPCKGVARNPEEPAGRLYTPAELAGIADALATYPGKVAADCVRLIMLTGCRPVEAKAAQWSEFDREPGFWIKPSSHTKQKREHRIPLSPPARQLVEQLREKHPAKPSAVFPGRSPDGTIDALWHCWAHVREHAGLGKDARLYDLRHSFASLGAGGGLSLPVIGRLLGHATAKTTERYARHLADDPLQAAVNMVAGKITGAGDDTANVVTIGRRP